MRGDERARERRAKSEPQRWKGGFSLFWAGPLSNDYGVPTIYLIKSGLRAFFHWGLNRLPEKETQTD